jgi:hypothetical protein
MGKNRPSIPEHKENEKRALAKKKRGFGRLAMKEAGFGKDQIGWCQRHDPHFKVKGKERHRALNG